jgi:hypothetical protein
MAAARVDDLMLRGGERRKTFKVIHFPFPTTFRYTRTETKTSGKSCSQPLEFGEFMELKKRESKISFFSSSLFRCFCDIIKVMT